MDNKFGCLEEFPSVRNYDYEIVCGVSSTTLPDTFLLPADRRPAVRDQGNIGACVAFSCVEIMEVLNKIEFNNDK